MSSKSAPPKRPAKAGSVKTGQQRVEDQKAERLAAALRVNLKRRKSQQRARDDAADDKSDGGPGQGGDT